MEEYLSLTVLFYSRCNFNFANEAMQMKCFSSLYVNNVHCCTLSQFGRPNSFHGSLRHYIQPFGDPSISKSEVSIYILLLLHL